MISVEYVEFLHPIPVPGTDQRAHHGWGSSHHGELFRWCEGVDIELDDEAWVFWLRKRGAPVGVGVPMSSVKYWQQREIEDIGEGRVLGREGESVIVEHHGGKGGK